MLQSPFGFHSTASEVLRGVDPQMWTNAIRLSEHGRSVTRDALEHLVERGIRAVSRLAGYLRYRRGRFYE